MTTWTVQPPGGQVYTPDAAEEAATITLPDLNQMRELRDDLASSASGAALVAAIDDGDGAYEETVSESYRERPSVLRYIPAEIRVAILLGTNTADLTAYFNKALVAAAGRQLHVPGNRTYKIEGRLYVPEDTWLDAYGATLDCTSGQFKVLTFANGGGVRGLTITGPASGTYNAAGVGVYCTGTNNHPAAPTFITAPVVEDCVISNFGYAGVFAEYDDNLIVRGCEIRGIGYAGVLGTSCNDASVTENLIETIGPGPGTADAYGVAIDRRDGSSETSDPRSYRCVISGNTIRTVIATGGINGQGIDTHGGVDFTIHGNTIEGCQAAIYVTASSISSVQQLGPKRVSVTGNTITGATSAGYGILISGAIVGGTVNGYAEQITVTGNTITGHGTTNNAGSGAIFAQGTKGLVVSGNALRRPVSVGINLNLENLGVNVTGNTVTDPHDNTFAAPCCVRVHGNINTGYIGGNTFVFENGALNTYVAVEAIRVAGGLTGLGITFGGHAFIGIDATHLAYVEATSTGVNAEGLFAARGAAALVADVKDVTFSQRFPSVPQVHITNTGDLNPIRIAAVSATGFTAAGTGTTAFSWRAS